MEIINRLGNTASVVYSGAAITNNTSIVGLEVCLRFLCPW